MVLSSESHPSPSSGKACAETAATADEARAYPLRAWPGVLLEMLAICGYGIWMLLGMALALGIYRSGRNEGLLPLALGAAFASMGLLVACLRLPWLADWHGWRPAQHSRPTREALLVLSTYLPMLAVAGLVRGDNAFWATRLAGAALMLCSLASLAYSARSFCTRLPGSAQAHSNQLSASRVVTACYGGGLWLWLCLVTEDAGAHAAGTRPWIMALLLLALLLGLLEGMRWQTFHVSAGQVADTPRRSCRPRRYMGALLTYAVPSVALLLVDLSDAGSWLVGVAAISCVVGKTIEQHAYEAALAGRLVPV